MEKIRYAVRVFAFVEDKVVCIKYKENNVGFYDIPGGKIEDGESEIEACIREFKEETGMDVNDLECVGNAEIVYPNRTFEMKTFVANSVVGNPQEFEENFSCLIPISEIIKKDKRFAITYLLDDERIECFKNKNLNIVFKCDENHNVLDIQNK